MLFFFDASAATVLPARLNLSICLLVGQKLLIFILMEHEKKFERGEYFPRSTLAFASATAPESFLMLSMSTSGNHDAANFKILKLTFYFCSKIIFKQTKTIFCLSKDMDNLWSEWKCAFKLKFGELLPGNNRDPDIVHYSPANTDHIQIHLSTIKKCRSTTYNFELE